MCRRIILCSLFCVLLCCSCMGVAIAADEPESDPADDSSLLFEQFLQDLGFDPENEEEISLFLTWLYPLQPGNEREMALILSGSEYSTLDPDMVYSLWQFLQDVIDDSEFYWAGDNTGGTGTSSQGPVSVGYIGWLQSQPTKLFVMQRLPNNSADAGNVPILATIDLASVLAEQGYLTQASLTTVENLIRETNSFLNLANVDLGLIKTKLDGLDIDLDLLHTDLDLLHTDQSLLYIRLGFMENDLESLLDVAKDMYSALRGDISGNIWSYVQAIDSNIRYMRNTQFPELFSFSRSWSYDGSSNSIKPHSSDTFGLAELLDVNFKDLDSLLLTNLSAPRDFSYNQVSNTLTSVSGGKPIGITQAVNDNFKDLDSLLLRNLGLDYGTEPGKYVMVWSGEGIFGYLSALVEILDYGLANSPGNFLFSDGSLLYKPYSNGLVDIVSWGLQGLNRNMEVSLVGGHDGSAQYSQLTFDENLYKSTKTVNYTDLLHAMVGIGSDIQNPLSQLQAVLAGEDVLELKRNTQENIDSVTDNFTGSGDGAVSGGDISDASGLTSGIGNAFGGNQVSTGDFFSVAGDSDIWSFFTEESAQSLDAVTYPAAVVLDADDDSWLDDFVADENGFYSVADQSGWSVLDYLGKEG